MKKLYRNVLVSVMMLLTCIMGHAQERVVSGTVKDPSGMPIPGANILVKGTSIGTTSDAAGKFSLNAAPEHTLVISFIGYTTQEIIVANQTSIDVALLEDVTTLSEIVLIGYGEQKKTLSTGANLQVKGDDILKLSTTNALQALQGQTPGVQITSTSGQPGEGMRVIVRGIGSLAGQSPLYVVDGMQTGDISYLNPADIQSVDILKDAASAAIYGAQASNGVVLITTKKGTKGKMQLTFDSYYGVQKVVRKADMLNGREYASIMNEAAVNSGKLPYFTAAEIDSLAVNANTNWMNEMFVKNASTANYVLGLSGGSETSVFSASLAYTSQEGIVGGKDLSSFERYNFRINSEHEIFDGLIRLGENLSFSYRNNRGIQVDDQYNNTLRGAFNTSPFVPMYDSLGEFYDNSNSTWFNGEANPYAQMVYGNQQEDSEQKLLGNVYAEIEPIKGLKLRTSLGMDYYANNGHAYTPVHRLSIYAFSDFDFASQDMAKGRTMLWNNLLSYDFALGRHNFSVMAGTESVKFDGVHMNARNRDVIFNDLGHAYLGNATNTDGANISLGGSANDPTRRLSYFGRLSYNLSEKYLLNVTMRADGSSNFANGNRWGYFPSVSAGWVVSEESFMNTSFVEFLKIRGSWGQVGNQNVSAFRYVGLIRTSTTNYSFGIEEGVLTPGAYQERLSNPDLQWETSQQVNVGFDSRILGGAMSIAFDWYRKTSKDWLIEVPVLATAGALPPTINGGNVTNTGIELALSYTGRQGDFGYTVSVNGAYNQNTVNEIPTPDGIIHGQTNSLYANSGEFYRAQTGEPVGFFWGLETNGLFQTEEEVSEHTSSEGKIIQPGAKPGDVRYVDQDDNGIINDEDRRNIGNPNPDMTFGITLTSTYRGFDFTILASGVAGNQIVQSYRNHSNQYANYTSEILDRWHGPGSSNKIPRVTENSQNWVQFSDLYIHDGDYLRISNITIGYNFSTLVKKSWASKLRVYASALNLYTFTKYNGMDPEIGYGLDGGPQDRFSSGIDLGYYPRPRTYLIGVNLSF